MLDLGRVVTIGNGSLVHVPAKELRRQLDRLVDFLALDTALLGQDQ